MAGALHTNADTNATTTTLATTTTTTTTTTVPTTATTTATTTTTTTPTTAPTTNSKSTTTTTTTTTSNTLTTASNNTTTNTTTTAVSTPTTTNTPTATTDTAGEEGEEAGGGGGEGKGAAGKYKGKAAAEGWLVPPFQLPLDVHVVHHPGEPLSKSTAVHAVVLCPKQVRMYEFPDVPPFDAEHTVLLYPDPNALPMEDVDVGKYTSAVFIDCKWKQAAQIRAHPALRRLTTVGIRQYHTLFWRHQTGQPRTSLATVEAIYYFCREYRQQQTRRNPNLFPPYQGTFDDLLFYFKLFYDTIQVKYRQSKAKFTQKHYTDYIKPDERLAAGSEEQEAKRRKQEE